MNITTRPGAMCAGLLLAVLIVACGDDDDDGGDTGGVGPQLGAEIEASLAGTLICIRDISAFPTYPAANRVYALVDRPRDAAAVDRPQVWIDFDPESTTADAVSVRADYLSDIADEVSDQEFDPGDSC